MSKAIIKSEVIQGEIVLEKEEKPARLVYEDIPVLSQFQASAQFASDPDQAQKEIMVIRGEWETRFQRLDEVIRVHRHRFNAFRDFLKQQKRGDWTKWHRQHLSGYSTSHLLALLDTNYEKKQAKRSAAAKKANATRKGQRPSPQPAQETVVEEVVIPSINPLDALLSAYLQTLGDEDGEPAPSKLRGFFSKLDPEWTKNSLVALLRVAVGKNGGMLEAVKIAKKETEEEYEAKKETIRKEYEEKVAKVVTEERGQCHEEVAKAAEETAAVVETPSAKEGEAGEATPAPTVLSDEEKALVPHGWRSREDARKGKLGEKVAKAMAKWDAIRKRRGLIPVEPWEAAIYAKQAAENAASEAQQAAEG